MSPNEMLFLDILGFPALFTLFPFDSNQLFGNLDSTGAHVLLLLWFGSPCEQPFHTKMSLVEM